MGISSNLEKIDDAATATVQPLPFPAPRRRLQKGPEPHRRWQRQLALYRRRASRMLSFCAGPRYDEERFDVLVDESTAAMLELIAVPAPSVAEAATKLDLLLQREGVFLGDDLQAALLNILSDLKRLG